LDSVPKTRKLEAALRLEEADNTEDDIDFILFEACLSEYDEIEDKLEQFEDEVSKVFSLLVKKYNYNVDEIIYILDMEEDGVVTFKEFQAVCLDLAPKATSKKGEATITRNSISSAFSSVVADDSGDQEIPVPAFKSFIVNFIARLKNSILKKVYEFVSENSKVLLSQCESRETQEMTKKGYSQGYLSFNNFKRVFEKEKYDLTDQEMNALRNSHPKFFKEEKVFYKGLIEDICKSAKSI
jgi:Ca2+-binding EF-hand superfamily protein